MCLGGELITGIPESKCFALGLGQAQVLHSWLACTDALHPATNTSSGVLHYFVLPSLSFNSPLSHLIVPVRASVAFRLPTPCCPRGKTTQFLEKARARKQSPGAKRCESRNVIMPIVATSRYCWVFPNKASCPFLPEKAAKEWQNQLDYN